MTTARYNRRQRMKSWSQRAWGFVCLAYIGMMLAWSPMCKAADGWDVPTTELAHQIASLTGPGTVALTIRNNSSISLDEIPAIRRSLLNNLSALGVTVRAGGDAATAVRVTLSQTAQQGLWVAEIQQGPEVRVAMVRVANTASATKPQGTPVLLRKTLLISQADLILDAGLIALPSASAERRLVVLSPEQISIYRSGEGGGAWAKGQSFPIAHERPYPRDVRGRLQVDASGMFKAYLPGVICTASQQATVTGTNDVVVACADSDDPWPADSRSAFYNASRNYFTGVTIPNAAGNAQPFYSEAELVGKRGAATVFSEVAGQFRVFDGSGLKVLAGSRDWGSDIAGVQSGCGAGAQLLVTASGDARQDSLLAYEVEGHEAIAASAPLPLDGRVTAMWPANGQAAATVVVETEQPLQYEAYSVSLVCNQ